MDVILYSISITSIFLVLSLFLQNDNYSGYYSGCFKRILIVAVSE